LHEPIQGFGEAFQLPIRHEEKIANYANKLNIARYKPERSIQLTIVQGFKSMIIPVKV
jgi:hypothetical protein